LAKPNFPEIRTLILKNGFISLRLTRGKEILVTGKGHMGLFW
jgi:hypothetical protein|tara:strand:- start:245 stop:370 length:126 start_codon:yes stop_codon:yes gene_type:complete